MDKSSLSFDEEGISSGFQGLSLSLVSYGSDIESLDDSVSNLKKSSDPFTESAVEDSSSVLERTLHNKVSDLFENLSATGLSNEKKFQLEAAIAAYSAAQKQYFQKKEVNRALKDVAASDSILPKFTFENVRKLLLRVELKHCFTISKNPDIGPLGLTKDHLWIDCPRYLSEADQKLLSLAVSAQLAKNTAELKKSESSKLDVLRKLLGREPDSPVVCVESSHTVEMAALKDELKCEVDNYYQALTHLDSVLESLVKLKVDKIGTMCLKTIETLEAKAQTLKQKASCLNAELQSAIYMEDEHIVPAMHALQGKLKLLCCEVQSELTRKNSQLEAYKRIQGPEFQKVLEEYKAVSKQIKCVTDSLNTLKSVK